MKKKQKYDAPLLEVFMFTAEAGYAASNSLPNTNWDDSDTDW